MKQVPEAKYIFYQTFDLADQLTNCKSYVAVVVDWAIPEDCDCAGILQCWYPLQSDDDDNQKCITMKMVVMKTFLLSGNVDWVPRGVQSTSHWSGKQRHWPSETFNYILQIISLHLKCIKDSPWHSSWHPSQRYCWRGGEVQPMLDPPV